MCRFLGVVVLRKISLFLLLTLALESSIKSQKPAVCLVASRILLHTHLHCSCSKNSLFTKKSLLFLPNKDLQKRKARGFYGEHSLLFHLTGVDWGSSHSGLKPSPSRLGSVIIVSQEEPNQQQQK